MGRCCICGNYTNEGSGVILINGRTIPVCDICGKMLDDAEKLQQDNPQRHEIYSALQERMRNSGAQSVVIETINNLFSSAESSRTQEYVEMEKKAQDREEQEERALEIPANRNEIEVLSNFLSIFAIIGLIGGIVLSLILGISLIHQPMMQATGWVVIVGGILLSILCFAIIMLALKVSSAIGSINDKMDDTNSNLENLNKKLTGIVKYYSSDTRGQTNDNRPRRSSRI